MPDDAGRSDLKHGAAESLHGGALNLVTIQRCKVT